MGLFSPLKNSIKLKGDKSLSKRDFLRVSKPLEKFGAKFKTNSGKLPIKYQGTNYPKPINYFEKKDLLNVKVQLCLLH